MLPQIKKKKKSLKYCCVCSGIYRGQVLNGRTISLHRFPQNKRLKRVWIQRCKTVMKTFKWNEHKLLCSEHFIDNKGPSALQTIPSLFPSQNGSQKVFSTSRLDENEQVPESEEEIEKEIEIYTATPVMLEQESNTDMGPSMETDNQVDGPTFVQNDCSMLDVSLLLHDYCEEPVPLPLSKRNTSTQTYPQTVDQMTQTDNFNIKQYVDTGTQESKSTCEVSEQTNLPLLVYEDVMNCDSDLMFYTGIPNRVTFEALFDEMTDAEEMTSIQFGKDKSNKQQKSRHQSGGRPRTLRLIDEFFMVLMRLRLGLIVEDLGYRFGVSSTACGRIVNKWIDYLDAKLNFLVMWPSMATVRHNMPKVFKNKFPDTRVIIDCTEIRTESPSSLQLKSLMYSDYKSHNTWKALVGISPSGHVTFVSDLWVGSVSNKQITKESGLLELCEKGDAIMADKGFLISDLTTPKGIKLIIPPFKKANTKFTKSEVLSTRDIANLRIHVERQMERIKNFRILQGVMPITMSKQASKVWKLCTKLTNLQPPLVPH